MSTKQVETARTFDGAGTAEPIGLYVHIPFCETKCPYCDFNTYAAIEPLIPDYVAALRREIELWGQLLGRRHVATVFFGGGTPSYIPDGDLASVLASVHSSFRIDEDAEVTVEANPGDLTVAKLRQFRKAGVNRLSIGVQSFDDGLLELLGRRHNADEAAEAYRAAREAGFDNASIDLMYGLPHQTLDQWRTTLATAVDLRPPHISMYALTLEGGTPMHRQVESGRLPEPDPDLAADMYLLAEETMSVANYRHYEISNWAEPGLESRHNLTYWKNGPFLGVGPGAHSYLGGSRFHNLKSPGEYVRFLNGDEEVSEARKLDGEAIKRVPVVETAEPIDRRLEMAETMMMGLRLDVGINTEEFRTRFGSTPDDEYHDILQELESFGLLELVQGSVRLTSRGRMLGNEVFSRFFA